MKYLAPDTQSFSKMLETDALYVDKTMFVHKMVVHPGVYFLSHPRRFGKSLMVSTLEALFEGRKELFEELYIYDKWDWSKRFPVKLLAVAFSEKTVKCKIQNHKP